MGGTISDKADDPDCPRIKRSVKSSTFLHLVDVKHDLCMYIQVITSQYFQTLPIAILHFYLKDFSSGATFIALPLTNLPGMNFSNPGISCLSIII